MNKMEETIATCTNLDTLSWWVEHFGGLARKAEARMMELLRDEKPAAAKYDCGGLGCGFQPCICDPLPPPGLKP